MTRRRRVRKRVTTAERAVFRYAAMAVFFALATVVILFGLTHDLNVIVAISGILVFLIGGIVLPKDRIRSALESLATGSAGEALHEQYVRRAPWKNDSVNPNNDQSNRRRGLASPRTMVALGVVLLALGLGLALVSGTSSATPEDCDTQVDHDAFLYDEETVTEVVETGNSTSIADNTRVSVGDTDAFLRIEAENPNAYCVDMTVKIHPDIVAPANVGDVDDKDGDVSSDWKHIHDFDADQSYTEVSFTLEAESESLFAPSTVRTTAINWKDERSKGIRGIVENAGIGERDVQQHRYDISAENTSFVTVPLSDEDRTVEEYHAFYRVHEDDPWRPVTTDSSDPVFERNAGPDDEIQFVFNDENAVVEFTANPKMRHSAQAEMRSLRAGLSDLNPFNWSIGATQSLIAEGGERGGTA